MLGLTVYRNKTPIQSTCFCHHNDLPLLLSIYIYCIFTGSTERGLQHYFHPFIKAQHHIFYHRQTDINFFYTKVCRISPLPCRAHPQYRGAQTKIGRKRSGFGLAAMHLLLLPTFRRIPLLKNQDSGLGISYWK